MQDTDQAPSGGDEPRPATANSRQALLDRAKDLQKRKQSGLMKSTADKGRQSTASRGLGSLEGSRGDTAIGEELLRQMSITPMSPLPKNSSSEDVPEATLPDADREHKLKGLLDAKGFDHVYVPGGSRFDVVTPTSPVKQAVTDEATIGKGGLFFHNLDDFVCKPAPEGVTVQCNITRKDNQYFLKMERGGEKVFLLSGIKRKAKGSSNYVITTSSEILTDGENIPYLAKLRANFVGTNFTIFDNGRNHTDSTDVTKELRKELGLVVYDTNLLGWKGPRKMTVYIPSIDPETGLRTEFQPTAEADTLPERVKMNDLTNLLELKNKQPTWNSISQSYVLDFKSRVTQASVKNFQIVHDRDINYIIMQFGRIEDDTFNMDFQYPMSAVQAFAIALSSFAGKLACE